VGRPFSEVYVLGLSVPLSVSFQVEGENESRRVRTRKENGER